MKKVRKNRHDLHIRKSIAVSHSDVTASLRGYLSNDHGGQGDITCGPPCYVTVKCIESDLARIDL